MPDKAHFSKDISIIIVNYNVKEFLANLLSSVYKAVGQLDVEIMVVDNASKDHSVSYLKEKFPDVIFIENSRNVGFGRANNQAIRQAKGTYSLLINPDTLIRENTLSVLKEHMDQHPETGAAGCKIINPDGTFALESRRAIPTPISALWKVLGLSALFPKSKTFADYYMSWMDENKSTQVPVLSGSFMFCRTDVLQEAQGFDEQFFMYGEDIDLCYRINKLGYDIDYVPATSIVHYKGESTKKGNLDYIVLFNKALYQFFKKHYSYGYSLFFRLLIVLGIILRGIIHYLKTQFKKNIDLVSDVLILNFIIAFSFIFRYAIPVSNVFRQYDPFYLIINVLVTVNFLLVAKYYDLYGKRKGSITLLIKTVFLAFAGVALITFFLRQFAFSRLILVIDVLVSASVLSLIRLLRKNFDSDASGIRGRFRNTRVLVVGDNGKTSDLIRKIRSKIEWNFDIKGIVSQNGAVKKYVENVSVLGNLTDLSYLVKQYKIDQVLFMQNAVSYNDILHSMIEIQNPGTTFKIVPDSLDFIIGKSNVEYLENIPIVDVELAYQKNWNRFVKRMFDIVFSIVILVISTIFVFPFIGFQKSKIRKIQILVKNRPVTLKVLTPVKKHKWLNYYLLSWYVCKGVLSYVGAPIWQKDSDSLNYKPGITGLRQINELRLFHEEEKEQYEIYYLQNYSIWLDLDIIIKTVLKKINPIGDLDENYY